MFAVQGQDCSLIAAGLRQDRGIRHSLLRSTRILDRQHVVSQTPEDFDYGQGEVSFAYKRAT
jgi:hypothetical protein